MNNKPDIIPRSHFIGRMSDLHSRTENYSSRCFNGNHDRCSGLRGYPKKHCECAKCNHPLPPKQQIISQ